MNTSKVRSCVSADGHSLEHKDTWPCTVMWQRLNNEQKIKSSKNMKDDPYPYENLACLFLAALSLTGITIPLKAWIVMVN